MLQGREINPLFLSPAPGIEPGSAGVQRRRFTHLPSRPTSIPKQWRGSCAGNLLHGGGTSQEFIYSAMDRTYLLVCLNRSKGPFSRSFKVGRSDLANVHIFIYVIQQYGSDMYQAKKKCVSDHMGLQNRVGRSGFFFWQYFFIVLRVRF